MESLLDMLKDAFAFFVDIGNRIDIFGLNLWDVSFVVFLMVCILRFVFPILFSGEGAVGRGSADTVAQYREHRANKNTSENISYGVAKSQSRNSGGRPIG